MAQDTIEARNQGSFPLDDPTQGLEQDHRYVRQLMQRYLATRDQQVKHQAGPQICSALEMHSALEETVFYPRVQEIDAALVERCLDEHQETDQLVKQLRGLEPGDQDYDDLMQLLHDVVMEHIQAEESQLFPAVRDSSLDLRDLAVQMQAFEANLVSAQARSSQSGRRPDQMH